MNWCAATTSEKLPASSVSTASSSALAVDDDDRSSSSATRKAKGILEQVAIAMTVWGAEASPIEPCDRLTRSTRSRAFNEGPGPKRGLAEVVPARGAADAS
jgi:hypothetical protein